MLGVEEVSGGLHDSEMELELRSKLCNRFGGVVTFIVVAVGLEGGSLRTDSFGNFFNGAHGCQHDVIGVMLIQDLALLLHRLMGSFWSSRTSHCTIWKIYR